MKPFIFGFSVNTSSYNNALLLAKDLKFKYPDCIIVFGGIHPSTVPNEVLNHSFIDLIVRGEAEHIITDVYDALKNQKSFKSIPGVSYKTDTFLVVHNPIQKAKPDLKEIPPFPFHLFNYSRYDMGNLISSRGCLYHCIFCSKISDDSIGRYASTVQVIDEISDLFHNYGKTSILFNDDDFLQNHKRVRALVNAIKSSDLFGKIKFSFAARGDSCDESLLKELFDVGFVSINLGIETASENLMRSIHKGEKLDKIIDAIRMAKKIGFHVSINFIFGLPGETHKDRMEAIKLAKKLQVNLVKYSNATPFPGTKLYEIAQKEKRLNIIGNYENLNTTATMVENPFVKKHLPYIPQGSTEKQLRFDILFAYLCYYMSFKKLKSIFTKPEYSNAWYNFGDNTKSILKNIPGIVWLMFLLSIKFSFVIFTYPYFRFKK